MGNTPSWHVNVDGPLSGGSQSQQALMETFPFQQIWPQSHSSRGGGRLGPAPWIRHYTTCCYCMEYGEAACQSALSTEQALNVSSP